MRRIQHLLINTLHLNIDPEREAIHFIGLPEVHSGMYDRLLPHLLLPHLLCESLNGTEEASFMCDNLSLRNPAQESYKCTYLSIPSQIAVPDSRLSRSHLALSG